MEESEEETEKRIKIAERQAERFRDSSLGVILTGSVAYAPNLNVTPKSDLDLIVIHDEVRNHRDILPLRKDEKQSLEDRFFEGYCVKFEEEGVPVSIHSLSKDAMEIISRCFVADIRVYRPSPKIGSYSLNGFEGQTYDYNIKNINLNDLNGFRTIVPISFINEDRHHIGIHRDKLLSHPRILHEKESYISGRIDKLWRIVTQNLLDEANRVYGELDLEDMNVLNALAKKKKMSEGARAEIMERTRFYLEQIK